mmetsp:Transcript_43799/g.78770  ORF Transcript_43799/g.78770 Transcript_43799/m.78770 type:complete len:230 (-) Transcript_43799:138-827(-)
MEKMLNIGMLLLMTFYPLGVTAKPKDTPFPSRSEDRRFVTKGALSIHMDGVPGLFSALLWKMTESEGEVDHEWEMRLERCLPEKKRKQFVNAWKKAFKIMDEEDIFWLQDTLKVMGDSVKIISHAMIKSCSNEDLDGGEEIVRAVSKLQGGNVMLMPDLSVDEVSVQPQFDGIVKALKEGLHPKSIGWHLANLFLRIDRRVKEKDPEKLAKILGTKTKKQKKEVYEHEL